MSFCLSVLLCVSESESNVHENGKWHPIMTVNLHQADKLGTTRRDGPFILVSPTLFERKRLDTTSEILGVEGRAGEEGGNRSGGGDD